jgi:hypothetical protein
LWKERLVRSTSMLTVPIGLSKAAPAPKALRLR